MRHFSETVLTKYLENIKNANSELAKKELFKDLLVRLFDQDEYVSSVINKMSLGAEKTIFNIPLKNRIKTGSADTQYNKVIIEFERNLSKTGEHAKEQLAEYFAGNWKNGENHNFTLIASDCINWKVYAPDTESLIYKKQIKSSDIKLVEVDSYILNDKNVSDFPFFIDRYLFKTEKVKATLENITIDFGEKSQVFLACYSKMREYFLDSKELESSSELKVAYEQWSKFLSIAYGRFNPSFEVFLVHTYLSIFSKILAYTILTKDIYIDDKELKGILKGDIFDKYNIKNFIDDDFYHWVSIEANYKKLRPVLKVITQKIDEFDFANVEEDILKGVYQELIDLETRHALGEYYTPDWLCQKIVDELDLKKNSCILDPACGSGSFLQATVTRLKKISPELTAEEITNQVIGIDIHPLSVQISKTTLLLSIQDKVQEAKQPIFLKVFLANTLLIPDESIELFGKTFILNIDKKPYSINTKIFENSGIFDNAISISNELADFSQGSQNISLKIFESNLIKKIKGVSITEIESFYEIYKGLKEVKEAKRDDIWKFILQNLYKPFFLKERFDFVVGNPPWITYADISNAAYQEQLLALAQRYNLVPSSKANMPHLEIAAIFLAHCSSYFLREQGSISFVLPRSFLSADHHDNTRSGKASGFKIKEVWDLENVSPLFRVPSCVILADAFTLKSSGVKKIPEAGVTGLKISGNLGKKSNITLKAAQKNLTFNNVKWFYSKLSTSSALTNTKRIKTLAKNFYKDLFKQGATIVPRNFYFVEPEQEIRDYKDRILKLKTDSSIIKDSKPPWKEFVLSGRVSSNFLFYTALAKNIVPFALIDPLLVLLPIEIQHNKQSNSKEIVLLNSEQIFKKGELESAKWFKQAEQLWDEHKTEKSESMSSIQRLNFQRGVIEQNLNIRFLVLYTSSAKDANAVVISRENFELEFIVESKAYWFGTNNIMEAHYVSTFLNSTYANKLIKDFQSKGLFGPRDIHKKILEVPLPKFDRRNEKHLILSKLGEICANKTLKFVEGNFKGEISGLKLGKLRLQIRKYLDKEIKEMDKILKNLI